MPFTTVKVIEGVFSHDQKTQFIDKITEAMVEVEGEVEAMRDLTWVVIDEVKVGDWANRGTAHQPQAEGGLTRAERRGSGDADPRR
jgi:4-oxalocrotonate tautomerase